MHRILSSLTIVFVLLAVCPSAVASSQEPTEEESIKDSINRVSQALSERSVEIYGSAVTEDLLNMTLYAPGQDIVTTYGRQARLDQLEKVFFSDTKFETLAEMTPLEIHVSGDRAFVIVDGTLTYTPKQGISDPGQQHKLDIYMFYFKHPKEGWQTERSMAIVRETKSLKPN